MKKLDPRSVIIGFLLAVISLLSMGFTEDISHSNNIEVTEIVIKEGGSVSFAGSTEPSLSITSRGISIKNSETGVMTRLLNSGLSISEKDSLLVSLQYYTGRGTFFNIEGRRNKNKHEHQGVSIVDGLIHVRNTKGEQVALLGRGPDEHGLLFLADKYGDLGWVQTGKQ